MTATALERLSARRALTGALSGEGDVKMAPQLDGAIVAKSASPPAESAFTFAELRQLCRLVYQAFDLRGTPYCADACRAIYEWRLALEWKRLQAADERQAQVVRLLRRVV